MRGKGKGWRKESHRHRLAGMGISTKTNVNDNNLPEDIRPSIFKYIETETESGRKKKMFVEIISEKNGLYAFKEHNKYGESKEEIFIGRKPKVFKDAYWNIKYGMLVVLK